MFARPGVQYLRLREFWPVAIYLDDKRLVKQLLAHDEQAFDTFFNDNFARLYRFALIRVDALVR
jgi:hypothetical protein